MWECIVDVYMQLLCQHEERVGVCGSCVNAVILPT